MCGSEGFTKEEILQIMKEKEREIGDWMNEDVKDIEIISSKRWKDLLVKITFADGEIFQGWVEKQWAVKNVGTVMKKQNTKKQYGQIYFGVVVVKLTLHGKYTME